MNSAWSFSKFLFFLSLLTASGAAYAAVPVVDSPANPQGEVGVAFNYTITASGGPIVVYGASGMPSWLSRSGANISGTPTVAGDYIFNVFATNDLDETSEAYPVTVSVLDPAPVITSALSVNTLVNEPFSYTIVATNNPTSYGAVGLGALGLSIDGNTGIISGTPTASGSFDVVISATNATGSDSDTLTISVLDTQLPVITSSTTASGTEEVAFTYQISASNNPTSYGVTGLNAISGLVFSTQTGLISGTPTTTGVFNLTISASNDFGDDTENLTITIDELVVAPVIVSSLNAEGFVGTAFNYTISALNTPTSYGVVGLGAIGGLNFNTDTGVISGVPTTPGSYGVSISATNSAGMDSAQLTITVSDAEPPVITSLAAASGVINQNFNYQITATNTPTSFDADGLDDIGGLIISPATGLISGLPTNSGVFTVTVSASNAFGTDTLDVVITIDEIIPVITSSTTAAGVVGRAFNYQITAINSPTLFDATGIAAIGGLSIDVDTGLISGFPVNSGTFTVSVEASNTAGSDFQDVTITVFGAAPTITITSPTSGQTINGNFASFNVTASIIASTGNTVSNAQVFVDGVVFAQLTNVGGNSYQANLPIGFDPSFFEVTGGNHVIQVRAYQSDGAFFDSSITDFEITPVIDVIYPLTNTTIPLMTAGDSFLIAKIGTNQFDTAVARLNGPGVFEDVTGVAQGNNVYAFFVSNDVSNSGTYTITLTVTDIEGNTVTKNLGFTMVSNGGDPSIRITSPANGFITDQFIPAIIQIPAGDYLGGDVGSFVNPETTGSGYLRRNTKFGTVRLSGVDNGAGGFITVTYTIENGKILKIDSVTGTVASNNGIVLDSVNFPGIVGDFEMFAEASSPNSQIVSVEYFVNGVSQGVIAAPGPYNTRFPGRVINGSWAPEVGTYQVFAIATDALGRTGIANPIVFSVRAFDYPVVDLIQPDGPITVDLGELVDFSATVDSNRQVAKVEFIRQYTDPTTGQDISELLGQATRQSTAEGDVYVLSTSFSAVGVSSVYAEATTIENDVAQSLPVQVTASASSVVAIDFLEPLVDTNVGTGDSIDFEFEASSTYGSVDLVEVIVNGVTEASLNAEPYTFTRLFSTPGTFTVRATATNSIGIQATTAPLTVTVSDANPLISDSDFITQTYVDLLFRSPTALELSDAQAAMAGGQTRGTFISNLMKNSTSSIAPYQTAQIYRTMVGDWLDYDDLETEWTSFNSLGIDSYAASLYGLFSQKYPQINIIPPTPIDPQGTSQTDPTLLAQNYYVNALIKNKYGVQSTTFSQTVVGIALYNASVGGVVNGNTEASLALTSNTNGIYDPSVGKWYSTAFPGAANAEGQTWGYHLPDLYFNNRVRVAQLIAGLLRREPTDAEVKAAANKGQFNLANYAQSLVDSAEYAARFTSTYNLTVSTNGSGSVTINPEQYDPQNPTELLYVSGSLVTLTAVPGDGSKFNGWTGSTVSSSNPLVVTITADTSLVANFSVIPVTVSTASVIATKMAEKGVTDPTSINPSIDYDGDGATNLEEFVFGTDSTSDNSKPVFVPSIDGDNLVVEVLVLNESELPDDMTILFECNQTLSASGWTSVPSGQISAAGVSQANVPTGYQRIRVTLPLSSNCSFLRGRIVVTN
ncbi:beta strand repeat-containing protein [Cerasicoccus arenae]|uniref:Dystroglycan-type cadherin-like domain-containing protein n=1 Tax=Cerasicoccus arenae TaxID=424488 RepID=A0A8J3DID4_9BACT|nr:putative Ig domain-containing protein [Cerasicoccus arenae]MBK1859636.1 putative Ig domain-containing protein [Cerasicoccus arenae]GHB96403.1 hypothetical protein GCM10007047_10290 [Cerasicoccus arenae]